MGLGGIGIGGPGFGNVAMYSPISAKGGVGFALPTRPGSAIAPREKFVAAPLSAYHVPPKRKPPAACEPFGPIYEMWEIAVIMVPHEGTPRMIPPPNEPGSKHFTADRESTKLWPIVEPADHLDHRLAALVAALLLVACAGFAINWAFS